MNMLEALSSSVFEDGIIEFNSRIYIPNDRNFKKIILQETHSVPYAGHLGYQKTLTIVKK